MASELIIRIAGNGGQGIDLAGQILANAFVSAGYHVFTNAEHYNSISGGHNSFQLRISNKPVFSHGDNPQILLAMETWALTEAPNCPFIISQNKLANIYVPMQELALAGGSSMMRNIVGIGACAALCGLDLEKLKEQMSIMLNKKGEQIIMQNLECLSRGFAYLREHYPDYKFVLPKSNTTDVKRQIKNGNTLAALGAIKAGCKFVAAYPMTPSSTILHTMAANADERLSVNHVEDEIAAANMAVGAGYAGARAMVCTSGGGYALMGEAVSFAGMIEAPVVFFEVQRPGPSTGLPTRTGQGDLRQILHVGQGCFPHVVLSPTTHEEYFLFARKAFDLAEKYQCPVTVLMEKFLGENMADVNIVEDSDYTPDKGKLLSEENLREIQNFQRYKITADGISPRSIPGQKFGMHIASSYEHSEDGSGTEDPKQVTSQNSKRLKKMEALRVELPHAKFHGPDQAEITLICWGGTFGPALEAAEIITAKGRTTNCLPIKYLNPLPPNLEGILGRIKHPVLVEGNAVGLLGGLLREKAGFVIQDKMLDSSGQPFTANAIAQAVLEFSNKRSL